jgi:hypothetical protein
MKRAREPLMVSILIGESRRRKGEHSGAGEVSEIFRTLVTLSGYLRQCQLRMGHSADEFMRNVMHC